MGAGKNSYKVNPHKGTGLDSSVSTQTALPTITIKKKIINRDRKKSNALFIVNHAPAHYESSYLSQLKYRYYHFQRHRWLRIFDF